MLYWEVILKPENQSLGKYNQEYFSQTKIGEIVKKLHEKEIREGKEITIISIEN